MTTIKKILTGAGLVAIFLFSIGVGTAARYKITNLDVDYKNNMELLNALNNGEASVGDKARVEVTEVEDNDIFGTVLYLGDYMWTTEVGNETEVGDEIVITLDDARQVFGMWSIYQKGIE